ncbi:hypothetical protein ALI144C_13825 [Actinosynnema sp. ALI-1.44]|nr:hypothetical protein ALI144C_13825 [Actinosynnema sp. ALI-1.44]
MSQLLGAPVLVVAMLVMVSLALIPQRRYLRVMAVLGWVVVWLDDQVSGHWSDWLGAAVVIACLGMFVSAHRAEQRSHQR